MDYKHIVRDGPAQLHHNRSTESKPTEILCGSKTVFPSYASVKLATALLVLAS